MSSRWIPWLGICVATLAAFPAMQTLPQTAYEAWLQTRTEVGEGLQVYFDQQFLDSAF